MRTATNFEEPEEAPISACRMGKGAKSMTITLDVTPEVEGRLQEEAQRLGIPFLAYARAVLARDPVALALARAPLDDEPETEEERAAVVEAREAVARGEVFSLDEVKRELGL